MVLALLRSMALRYRHFIQAIYLFFLLISQPLWAGEIYINFELMNGSTNTLDRFEFLVDKLEEEEALDPRLAIISYHYDSDASVAFRIEKIQFIGNFLEAVSKFQKNHDVILRIDSRDNGKTIFVGSENPSGYGVVYTYGTGLKFSISLDGGTAIDLEKALQNPKLLIPGKSPRNKQEYISGPGSYGRFLNEAPTQSSKHSARALLSRSTPSSSLLKKVFSKLKREVIAERPKNQNIRPKSQNIFRSPIQRSFLTEAELKNLVKQLAPRVNLFREVWKQNPQAEFHAGTSRDFIYWILRQFRDIDAFDLLTIDQKKKELLKLKNIDIADIVSSESDIDVRSSSPITINAERFGIKKIDRLDPRRFDLTSDLGRAEIDQGFVPAEKIVLSQTGLSVMESFGNGLKEIIEGNLSVHFSDDGIFWNSYWAKAGLNHPVLLCLRYIRLLSQDFYNRYGENGNLNDLWDRIPQELKEKIKRIFLSAQNDQRFIKSLSNPRFRGYLNNPVLKSFRSYTDPKASHFLLGKLHYMDLQERFPESIESINQFLFKKNRDSSLIDQNLEEIGISKSTFDKASSHFKDFIFLHGTRNPQWFRSILLQGIKPSEQGSVDKGLYGVSTENERVAINHCGSKKFILEFDIDPNARVLVTDSKYAESPLFKKWKRWKAGQSSDYSKEDFFDDLGVDIVAFKYANGDLAYCIKNSEVLSRARGKYWKLKSHGQLLDQISKIKTVDELGPLLSEIFDNSSDEIARKELIDHIPQRFFETFQYQKEKSLSFTALIGLSFLTKTPRTLEDENEIVSIVMNRHINVIFEMIDHYDSTDADPFKGDLLRLAAQKFAPSALEPMFLRLSEYGSQKALGWMIKNLLVDPKWAEFPRLVSKIIDHGSAETLKDLWLDVFSQPAFQKNEALLERITLRSIERIPQGEFLSFMMGEARGINWDLPMKLSPLLKEHIISIRKGGRGIFESCFDKIRALDRPPASKSETAH